MNTQSDNHNFDKKALLRGLISLAVYLSLSPAVLFFSAGTVKWPLAWAYSITTVTMTAFSRLLLILKFPDMALERASHRQLEGVKTWDRILSAIVGLFGNLAILSVAGPPPSNQQSQ